MTQAAALPITPSHTTPTLTLLPPPTPAPQPSASINLSSLLRGMPRSDDAERGVLTCLLHDPAKFLNEAETTLPPEVFYHAGHRLIYEEMLYFNHHVQKPLDLVTFSQHLLDRQLMDKIGGGATLADLFNCELTPAHFPYYGDMLRDKLLLRQIITACHEGVQRCYETEQSHDVRETANQICGELIDTIAPAASTRRKKFSTILADYLQTWNDRLTGARETGIPSRWTAVNLTFGGITPTMWLISGPPGLGKSTLAQNFAEDVLRAGRHAACFSYEMDEVECVDRFMVSRSRLDSRKVFFPKQHPPQQDDLPKVTAAVREMETWGLHLRCEPTWTIDQIEAEVRVLKSKHDLALVVIDYAQLVPAARRFDTRAQEMAHVSRSCKRISRVHDLAVIVLSQINDDGQTLDSRSFTQDASNYLTIEKSNETKHRHTGENPGALRVIKNRNGQKGGLLPIALDGARFTFVERE